MTIVFIADSSNEARQILDACEGAGITVKSSNTAAAAQTAPATTGVISSRKKAEKDAPPAGKAVASEETTGRPLTSEEAASATTAPAPETTPGIVEKIRDQVTKLAEAGAGKDVKAVLGKFGAAKASLLDPKDYEAALADLEALSQNLKLA